MVLWEIHYELIKKKKNEHNEYKPLQIQTGDRARTEEHMSTGSAILKGCL